MANRITRGISYDGSVEHAHDRLDRHRRAVFVMGFVCIILALLVAILTYDMMSTHFMVLE